MEIIHEAFDFNRQLKDIDDVLSVSGDKVRKFQSIPSLEDIGDLKLFVSVATVVYLRLRRKQDSSLASFEESIKNGYPVVTFRQHHNAQQIFINLMREHAKCFDFMFFGDDMACVLDTAFQPDINELFEQMAKLNSMLSILNRKSQLIGLSAMEWGIGAHYGEVFVSVQRHLNNDIHFNWSGLACQTSYELALQAMRNGVDTIYTSDVFFQNLKDKYKELMHKEDTSIYTANIINRPIKDWQTENLDNK
jgi:hypothetical protein